MKIVALANHILALPALYYLAENKWLKGVVSIEKAHDYSVQVENLSVNHGVPFLRVGRHELAGKLKSWLEDIRPDVVLVFTFSYRIPESLLAIPRLGFYNFHFGPLPQYRGSDPVFWQIRNGETVGGITVHRMTRDYDAGPILVKHPAAFFPGESYGIHIGRLATTAVAVLRTALEELKTPEAIVLAPQDEMFAKYYPRPTSLDLCINWEAQSADEIENLVNAANPFYGGAIASFRGKVVKLLEVSPAEVNGVTGKRAGTIVYADMRHGLFVTCSDDRCLRINIVQTTEGVMTGNRMAALGVRVGERFELATVFESK
jgi:methionyl-tRNA formyltransferase